MILSSCLSICLFSCFVFVHGAAPEIKTVGSYRYELHDNGKLLKEAISACKQRDAWLVEIKDEEIDNTIKAWTTHEVFVGAKYDDGWKWNDDSLMIYTSWDGNEPVIKNGHCLVIADRKWSYRVCNNGPKRYVCQSDVNYPGSFQITVAESKKTHDDAKTACANSGSRLVNIKTPTLDSYINIVDDSWTSGKFDGSWKWGDGTPVDGSLWGTSQPGSNSNDYCLLKTALNGWKSELCSTEASYICQNDVTSGDCSNDICLNRGKCEIVDHRYRCACDDGYFGTKCEKEIVNISTAQNTFNVDKGLSLSITFNIVSYDGNVDVKYVDIGNNEISLASTTKITASRLSDTAVVDFGPLDKSVEYTIYAASSNAKSQDITIVIEVVDHCNSNPCKNNGSCQHLRTNPGFNCSCTPAYEGNICEERVFVGKANCKYHVNHDEEINIDAANSNCKDLIGSLAMMKSSSIQDFVEEQVVKQYGLHGNNVYFWIGGIKHENLWHWADGTPVPLTVGEGEWAGPKQYMSDRSMMVLSSHPNRMRSKLRWIARENEESYGYICEVPETDPCTSFQCNYEGTCTAVGCQANCLCASGYIGTNCENEIFTITPKNQTFTSMIGENITVTLSISGYNDNVRIDVFEETIQSKELFRIYNVTNTIDIMIGPFLNQSVHTKYWFRATPQIEPDSYYKTTAITIVVQGPSKIDSIAPATLAIPTDIESNVIKCNATGVPIPTVLWYKEDRIVTNNSFKNIYQTYQAGYASLFVNSNSRENFGNYTCYSYNVVEGKRTASNGTAFLQGKIKLVSTTLSDDPLLGSASITCVYEGYPAPDVEWIWLSDTNSTEIDSSGIFSIQNTVAATSGFTNTTSRLKISLVDYLGPTEFACYGSNIYEERREIFAINKNLVVNQNRAFRIFDLRPKGNYSDFMNYCRDIASSVAKITDNQTQSTLAAAATQLGYRGQIYIGAQKLEVEGTSIWRWYDQSFLYNETEYERWQGGEIGAIVDGSYVAWAKNQPSLVGACLTMLQAKDWRWSDVDCSKVLPFICEKSVVGIPRRFIPSVDECSSNITINWTPAPEAIGIRHRIVITELDTHLTKAFTDIFVPKYQNVIFERNFTNLKRWTSYNIMITVCPDVCPYPSITAKNVTTHAGIPGQVSSAYVTQLNETCLIKWKMKSLPGITGFMINVLSTLMHVPSKSYIGKIFNEIRLVANTSDRHHFLYNLNRNYTFSIQAKTCAGAGPPLDVYGKCVTPTGPPVEVISPIVAPLPNMDDTVNITINFPDETNGPISCIFVIVVYKPNRSSEENITTYENLKAAMIKAESASLSANDAYISIAISRSDINKEMIKKMNISKTLGDNSLSSCNLTKPQKLLRKKREASPTTNIKAINLKLENNANYSYYTLSITPGENGILHYKMSETSFFKKMKYSNQNANTNLPLSIVIVGVSSFVILLAIIAIIFARRRKNLKKDQDQPDAISLTDIDPAPQEQIYANLGLDNCEPKSETEIPLEQLLGVYNLLRDKDCAKFYEQFEKLKKTANSLEYPTSVASSVSLKKKNRYKNILPSDYSRVKLKGEGDFSYINACYISGFCKPKKFIATQGPLPSTIIDFWRMILEQEVQVIIMLTKCMENGRRKCEKYWPDQGLSQQYGNIGVTNVEELSFGCFKLRTFRISRENQESTLHQMQFLNWPDHGVPISTTNLIRFCEAGRKHEIATDGPIVVHCSAGAGRTGAFIAYDFLLEESEALGSVDVYRCVLALRKQRVDMVQTCEQYMIVHKLILEHYLFGLTDTDPIEMKRMKESYSDATMKKQFEDLSTIGPLNQIRYQQGEKVSVMNRNNDIVPYEHNHVTITRSQEDMDILYVNASTIEIYGDIKLIAAQGPLKNTVEYFWRAILDNNINTIVMLTRCTEKKKEQCYRYWPEKEYTDIKVGNITIHLRAENIEEPIIRRELLVKRKDDEKTIIQYQYTKWDSNQCPENASDVLELVEKMKSCLKTDEYASALVHCSDGAGRTGAFCAIVNLLERLVNERRTDVFRAVKDLRDGRPGMVQTLDQYKFCYKAVSKYLESFSLYANIVQTEEDQVEENPYENI